MSTDGYGTAKAKSSPAEQLRSPTGREVLNSLQKAGTDLLRSAESAFSTLTGKKVLEKVGQYIQESDDVNTAMATRIYDLLDRQGRLSSRLSRVEKWLAVSLVLNGLGIIGFVFYVLFTRP